MLGRSPLSRSFAIRHRLQEHQTKCRSLNHIGRAAQAVFLESSEILKQQVPLSGPKYALRLLQIQKQLLSGKKLGKGTTALGVDVNDARQSLAEMKEACMLSVLEDVQDSAVSTKHDLMQASYLLEEQGQDEDTTEETQMLAQILYEQCVLRSHEFEVEEVQAVSAIFQRLTTLRVVEKPMPRLSDEMRKQAKRFTSEEDIIREFLPDANPGDPIYYDRRRSKLTVRMDVAGVSCRVIFQATINRNAAHLERLIDVLSKESPQSVLLPLSPFDESRNWIYSRPEEIDSALLERYSGRKSFKVGVEERVVYERVSNLKRVSINQSLLYNFSSEGAFPHYGIPVSLYELEPENAMCLLATELKNQQMEPADLLRNVQAQVLLDRLSWVGGEVLKYNGCPKCNLEKVGSGPESIHSPFINFISPKLFDQSILQKQTAQKIHDQLVHALQEGHKARAAREAKKSKSPSFVVFVDEKESKLTDFVNDFLVAASQPQSAEFNQETTDIEAPSELRVLFGDLDLSAQDEGIQSALSKLHSAGLFEDVLSREQGLLKNATRTTIERNCFVDKLLVSH